MDSYSRNYYLTAIPGACLLTVLAVTSSLPIVVVLGLCALSMSGFVFGGYFLGKRERK